MDIRNAVNSYCTKYEQGFTPSEIMELLKEFPDINMDKFNDAMMGNTGIIIDGDFITYHCDVELAIKCGVYNRDVRIWEWD